MHQIRDPIPRMLSDDDFMGAWLRNRPYTTKRIEQRAAMFQALFRGGWISANATDDSIKSEIDTSSNDHPKVNLRADVTANSSDQATTTVIRSEETGGDGDVAVTLSPVPEEFGSSDVTDLFASNSQSFEHVGTMHVILPGSRRVRLCDFFRRFDTGHEILSHCMLTTTCNKANVHIVP